MCVKHLPGAWGERFQPIIAILFLYAELSVSFLRADESAESGLSAQKAVKGLGGGEAGSGQTQS